MIHRRDPNTVMRLERLGAAHQTRLSFLRSLLRRMRQDGWRFDRPVWDIDANGVGRAVYRVSGPDETYSLVAFAHDLPDDQRSDRVIAEAWDTTFALCRGSPDRATLDRLAANVPKQEAGRVSDAELVLSRANRSGRLWSHVVDRLAMGRQPDAALVDDIGYLMRTTAVYGSGKFGAAEFATHAGQGLIGSAFRAEMLTVWLIRAFVADLVEHMARVKGGERAVPLRADTRRRLGIGNATGLGMAPFLVNHPRLLNAWISAREEALARVRAVRQAPADRVVDFRRAFSASAAQIDAWQSTHPIEAKRSDRLRQDVARLADHLQTFDFGIDAPWDALYSWAERRLSVEGQEWLVTLLLEPHGEIIDDLADTMAADEISGFVIDGRWTLDAVRLTLASRFDWLDEIDFAAPSETARFWYVSQNKAEPRLGERRSEPGADLEQPLGIARDVQALARDLAGWPDQTSVADFLDAHPDHRRAMRRVQTAEAAPYSEIRENLLSADLLPIDMLRCKLAFFGATRFDPKSDRWVRVTLFQNAPYPDEFAATDADGWTRTAAAPAEPQSAL